MAQILAPAEKNSTAISAASATFCISVTNGCHLYIMITMGPTSLKPRQKKRKYHPLKHITIWPREKDITVWQYYNQKQHHNLTKIDLRNATTNKQTPGNI